ncbi:hypothetical protein K110096F8_18150 [Dielma fastidiosa]
MLPISGSVLYHQTDFRYPLLLTFDEVIAALDRPLSSIKGSLQLLILRYAMLCEKVKGFSGLLKIVNFCPMCKTGTLLSFQIILYIVKQVNL